MCKKTSTKKRKEKKIRAGCLLMRHFLCFFPLKDWVLFFYFPLCFFLEKVCEACSGNLKGEENGVVGRVNGGSESQWVLRLF